jgi:4-diphosphocytidyl-2-C-methyl-D-erythritol kinase
MGAGLGGGSSDGAAALLLLNDQFKLGLSTEQLSTYSLLLGSDCPFFIMNQPAFASGRGEKLTPVPVDLSGYHITIVYPGIHISTAVAFSGIQPKPADVKLQDVILAPVTTWKEMLQNVFEPVATRAFPELSNIKSWLYEQGAVYASMTGTGAAFYGIFPLETVLPAPPETNWQVLSAR